MGNILTDLMQIPIAELLQVVLSEQGMIVVHIETEKSPIDQNKFVAELYQGNFIIVHGKLKCLLQLYQKCHEVNDFRFDFFQSKLKQNYFES